MGRSRRNCSCCIAAIWMICAASTLAHAAENEKTPDDALAAARAMNSASFTPPPGSFRPGTAQLKSLSADAVATSAAGFVIRLPSGAPIPSPAVHAGLIVTSGGFRSREVYGFDAKTGALRFGLALSDDGPSTPACADGICVFNTESCTVFAVDVANGKLLWSHFLGDPQLGAPAIGGDLALTVYPAQVGVGQPPGASHVLAAFELRTGAVRWQRWIDADVISAPVVAEGEVHLSSMAGTLYRFRLSDGEILAAQRVRATSAPTVAQGKVFYSKRAETSDGDAPEESLAKQGKDATEADFEVARKRAPYLDKAVQRESRLAASGKLLDAANGFASGVPVSAKASVAESNLGQANVSTLQAFQGSRVLKLRDRSLATMGDEVVATDAVSGKELWRRAIDGDSATSGGFLATPPVAAAGRIVVGTLSGEIEILSPTTGKLLQKLSTHAPIRSQPVVSDGWIYIGTTDGRLVALRTDDPTLTGWPQWGRDATRAGVAD